MNVEKSSSDVLRKVKEHVRNGTYILVKHAIDMQKARGIKLPDVMRVLEHGRHERDKDIFSVKNQIWKHAIRGKTINGADVRVIISLEKKMVIITVIRIK